ncbi:MAG: DUF2341 domain-containing protein, partial [Candidatus Bathyarchaeia archaeon]
LDLCCTNPATIYIYYGKSDATTTSNGANTFLFFDDFESYTDGSDINGQGGWVTKRVGGVGEAKVRLVNGRKHLHITSTNYQTAVVHQFSAQNNMAIHTYKYADDWDEAYDMGFGDGGYSTYGLVNGYWAVWCGWAGAYSKIVKYVSSTEYPLASISDSDQNNVYHKCDFGWYGSGLKAWKDGSLKLSATDTTFSSQTYLHLHCYSGSSHYIDWVFIRKYVDPEPSHSSWGSEEQAGGGQTHERSASQAINISASPTKISNFQRIRNEAFEISGYPTAQVMFTRSAELINVISSCVAKILTVNRQASSFIQNQFFISKTLNLQREANIIFQPSISPERILSLQRSTGQAVNILSQLTRNTMFTRFAETVSSIVSSIGRILMFNRQVSSLTFAQFSTARTLNIQRQMAQFFAVTSSASKASILKRTVAEQFLSFFSIDRIHIFVRVASGTVLGQASAIRWQQVIRQTGVQFQVILTALGEKTGFYERLVSQTVLIFPSAARTIQFTRLTPQSLTLEALTSRTLYASRNIATSLTILLSTSSQKISYGIFRTVDLSIIVNAIGQRTHASMTRTAAALFQIIVSANRWAIPLMEGVPSGPITTPNFEITIKSFTYNLNVFSNQLETKAIVKFQPLNGFDGNVTLNYWITNMQATETFASQNLTIQMHSTDRDPTFYTLNLNIPIFWTAITNDQLIWHLNAEYNGITTTELRILLTPFPLLRQAKLFTPYALIVLALCCIYMIFFKSD